MQHGRLESIEVPFSIGGRQELSALIHLRCQIQTIRMQGVELFPQ